MLKKSLAITVVVLFIGAGVVSGLSVDLNNSKPMYRGWLYVGGSGPGNYSTIQSAITAASAGDGIFVYSKTYYEHVNVDKSITLYGENKDTTIINGSGSDQAIEVLSSCDDILIQGFTCTNANIGIYVNYYCDHIHISDNILKNNLDDGIMINEYTSLNEIYVNSITDNGGDGIYLKDSTDNIISANQITSNGANGVYIYFNSNSNDVSGNTISNNSGYGMQISSSDYNNVSSNTVTDNTLDGIRIGYSDYSNILSCIVSSNIGHGLYFDNSDYSSIYYNNIKNNNGYGIYIKLSLNNNILSNTVKQNSIYGIYLAGGCDNNVISDNVVEGHSDFGILNYYYSNNNQITENTVNDNGCGIQIYDHCNDNIVSTNTITNNELGLETKQSSSGNLVYNNLFNNVENVYCELPDNIWNISKTPGANIIGGPYLGGNSFSDYTGEDVDGDGLGDTPYGIGGCAGCFDYLPLNQWDNIPPEISNVVVDPPEQNHNNYVEISCTVTDNYIVEQVCVIITYPDSTVYNFSMNPGYYFEQLYSQIGTYYFFIWAIDNNGNENISSQYSFEIINLPPDTPEKPSGKARGKINVEYTYSSVTTEPDGEEVYYWFDWGDGNNSGWVGPFTSGEPASAKYTWTEKGTYEIKVKAKDALGAESTWSEPLSVKMPRNKTLFNAHPILMWLLERFPILKHILGL